MGRFGMGARLLLLAATACALFSNGAYASPVELSSSVITFHTGDTYLRSDGGSLCTDMVARAAGYNAKRIQFVLTNKWMPPAGNPYAVQYYACDDSSGNYQEWNANCIALYTAGLKACFAAALKANFTQLVINPHLDDASSAGTWRNYLIFDPLKVYSTLNYRDAMLLPIVNALKATITSSTTVYFNFQGEMGATIFTYPASYTSLIPWVKSSIGKGNIKVGVAYNWATCLGYISYMNVQGVFQPNVSAVQTLFNSLDFFGISAYAPIPAAPAPADLENSIKNMQNELAGVVDVSNLILTQKKTFFYAEYGMGGGANAYGSAPATSAAQMVQRPDWGYFYNYQQSTDPWKSYLPATASDPLRTWNRMYYNVTTDWLSTGGGPTFRVDGLFLWSTVSYDIQAISYVSTSSQGSYLDPVICQTIRTYNAYVNGGSTPTLAAPTPSTVKTPSPTPSPAKTPSPTPSPAKTPSPTPSPAKTPSPTPSPAKTPTPTPSPAKTPSPTPAPSTATVTIALWGQCGGQSGSPPAGSALVDAQWAKTACASGAKCVRQNQWYWQCIVNTAALPIQSQLAGHDNPASVSVTAEGDTSADVAAAEQADAATSDTVDVYVVNWSTEAAANGTTDAAADSTQEAAAASGDPYTAELTSGDAAAAADVPADSGDLDVVSLTADDLQAGEIDMAVATEDAADEAVAAV